MSNENSKNSIEIEKKKIIDHIKKDKMISNVILSNWDGLTFKCTIHTYYESEDVVKRTQKEYIWIPHLLTFKEVKEA